MAYDIGARASSQVRVTWTNAATGQGTVVYSEAADSPTGYRVGYFGVLESFGTTGTLTANVTGGGKLYSVGDNVAREQLGEPFSQKVGLQVDTTTGGFGHSETDLTIEGGPLPLTFTRYYAGHSDGVGPLGYRWSHTYETRVAVDGVSSNAGVILGAGRAEFFAWNSFYLTYAATDARVKSTLVKNANGSFTYRTKDNLAHEFLASGKLGEVRDLNGNRITLDYDATTGRLITVTDPGGRALTFAYQADGKLGSVTASGGDAVSYGYSAEGDLWSATDSAGGVRAYEYSRHRLTRAVDQRGKQLFANSLDPFNRVVTQTDATGATIAFTYGASGGTPAKGVTRVTERARQFWRLSL